MKIFYQPPSSTEGKRFFSRYAGLIPNLTVAGFLAQIVSAITEWGILYALLFMSLAPLWPEYANGAAITGATVGVAIIEIGLRRLLPFASRAVIRKQWKGYDGGISAVVVLATVLLLGASATLSFTGSRSLVSAVATPPTLASSAESDQLADREGALTKQAWEKDEADLARSFAARIDAARTSAGAAVGRIQGRIDRFRARERTSEEWYPTRIAELQQQKADAVASRDEQVAKLTEERERALTEVRDRYRSKLDDIDEEKANTRASIAKANEATLVDHQLTVSHHGGGLAWFTLVCLTILVVSIVVKELHHAGAGIEERVQPDAFTFEQGPFVSLYNALLARLRREVYCFVHWVERTTPEALEPVQPPVLWERGEDWRVKVSGQGGVASVTESADYGEAATGIATTLPHTITDDEVEGEVEVEPDAFDNASYDASDVLNWAEIVRTDDVITSELETGEDALTHSDPLEAGEATFSDPMECENCGEVYGRTRPWQKFCKPNCRKEYHARQHNGVLYLPGMGSGGMGDSERM